MAEEASAAMHNEGKHMPFRARSSTMQTSIPRPPTRIEVGLTKRKLFTPEADPSCAAKCVVFRSHRLVSVRRTGEILLSA